MTTHAEVRCDGFQCEETRLGQFAGSGWIRLADDNSPGGLRDFHSQDCLASWVGSDKIEALLDRVLTKLAADLRDGVLIERPTDV